MNNKMKGKCFFCDTEAETGTNTDKQGRDVICPVCGQYFIEGYSNDFYEQLIDKTKYTEQKALLRYYLKKNTLNKSKFYFFDVTYSWIQKILNEKTLPNIIEQTENLILYCGDNFKQGESFKRDEELLSVVGSENIDALDIIIRSLLKRNLLNFSGDVGYVFSLTFDGWVEYERIKKEKNLMQQTFENIEQIQNNQKVGITKESFIEIHSNIFNHIKKYIENRDYYHAVEEAYKVVIEKLREITGEEQASKAFNDINYKKIFKKEVQTQAEKDFREGIKFLCMAIQNFRNDKVHTLSREIDKNIAMHYISLASLAYSLIIKYSSETE